MTAIVKILKQNRNVFGPVISPCNLFVVADFSKNNEQLAQLNFSDPQIQTEYIEKLMREKQATLVIGKYNENRVIYDHSSVFAGEQRRTVHLGMDLFVAAHTTILCPYPGIVHSFNDNNSIGDYGPTIILQHEIEGVVFFTLYGHLRRESLDGLYEGKKFNVGEKIGEVGNAEVNGSWAPHLHFQIITDMQGKKGDYPGVASLETREKSLQLCPDPNLILQII